MTPINTATILPSLIRTLVPLAVGWVLSLWLTGSVLGFFSIDAGTAADYLTQLATVLITALYYTLVRLLEKYAGPYWGVLVGWVKQPVAYAENGDNVQVAGVVKG
jgi:hypothetical protein